MSCENMFEKVRVLIIGEVMESDAQKDQNIKKIKGIHLYQGPVSVYSSTSMTGQRPVH